MIPGKRFDPATETSRRPTPEKFKHLRTWADVIEHSIMLTSITEITNIDQQLEQISRFYVSSIIQRVIAQLTAQYNNGFRTLVCTEDGELKVSVTFPEDETIILAPSTNLIGNVKLAGAVQAITSAKIDFNTAASHTIVAGQAGKKIKITSLMFTVGGDTNITLKAGATAITGAMDFGGADEPRGMVDSHGYVPYEITEGEAFVIQSSAAVQVSGYVTGYIE